VIGMHNTNPGFCRAIFMGNFKKWFVHTGTILIYLAPLRKAWYFKATKVNFTAYV
jgi:hypothetical protein